MRVGAVADDLTGGTDLALAFSREGMSVLQVVGVPAPDLNFGAADVVVVSLKSRTIPADQAIEMTVASAKQLLNSGAEQLYFKYCSTFDSTPQGNIGPVIDSMLSLLNETRTIACPAFPENGRTVYKGHLFVGDRLLSESSMKDHPLTPMRDANLVRVLQQQTERSVTLVSHDVVTGSQDGLKAAFENLDGIAIVDATSEADLRKIGRAAASLRLVTGGSALAMGLPANFSARSAAGRTSTQWALPDGNRVILAGSCSAATRRQIEVARSAGAPSLSLDPMAIADKTMTVDKALGFVLEHGGKHAPIVYSSADPETVAAVQSRLGRNASGASIENFLGELAVKLVQNGFNRLIVAGGETSGAVVNALDVGALEIGSEIDPGVPWTRSYGDDPPVALALKSGNFGADDFFLKAWERLS